MEKIAVLMGGTSNEREISLQSGKNVADALASLGKYDVTAVDLTADNLDALPDGVSRVYIALHGGWGENGGVQAALDARKIPYTGPGAKTSRITIDKVKTKMVLEMMNVPTPAWSLASPDTPASPLPLPVVVKPPRDGSSVGVVKVARADAWPGALKTALAAQGGTGEVLVEEFVHGREMTVGIIDGEALPVVEIVTKSGWYGYDEKYVSDETRYLFYGDDPARVIPKCPPEKVQAVALDAWKALGCRGVTRVDILVSPLGRCSVLELNTSPGFTAHSLVPKSGMKTGLTFAGVCERILDTARHD
jgi:D-alanine-D-alanine ligase